MAKFIVINNNKSKIIDIKYINLDLITTINIQGIEGGHQSINITTIDGKSHCYSNDINSAEAKQLFAMLKEHGISP